MLGYVIPLVEGRKLDDDVVRIQPPNLVYVDPEGPTFLKHSDGVVGLKQDKFLVPEVGSDMALYERECLWTLSGEGDLTRGTDDFTGPLTLSDSGVCGECVRSTPYK